MKGAGMNRDENFIYRLELAPGGTGRLCGIFKTEQDMIRFLRKTFNMNLTDIWDSFIIRKIPLKGVRHEQ